MSGDEGASPHSQEPRCGRLHDGTCGTDSGQAGVQQPQPQEPGHIGEGSCYPVFLPPWFANNCLSLSLAFLSLFFVNKYFKAGTLSYLEVDYAPKRT